VLALRFLLLLGGRDVGDLQRARLLEGVVAAGIDCQLLHLQMHDLAHDLVEEVAVVADEQHGVRIALEEILQPQGRLEVEMVRGLVQQQQVGLAEEDGGECHAHAPAAGEVAAGALLLLGVEAEAVQDRRGARGGAVGLDVGEPCMDVGDAVRIGGMLGLGQQGGALAVGHQDGVYQALRPRRGLLRHHADASAVGQRDIAGIGMQLARDQLQQRRLAGAVAADQPGMVPGRQCQVGAVQQHPPAYAVGQVLDRQHGGAYSTTARSRKRKAIFVSGRRGGARRSGCRGAVSSR
jgi:hypothetical protein